MSGTGEHQLGPRSTAAKASHLRSAFQGCSED